MREERIRADQRHALLFPPALLPDDRYWNLSPIDQAVWRATRGHTLTVRTWLERLVHAVAAGLITEAEKEAAKARVERHA